MAKHFLFRLALFAAAAAVLPACGGSHAGGGGGGGGTGGTGVISSPFVLFPGATGRILKARGGTGSTGSGGNGGSIQFYNRSASNGYLLAEGSVDTTFATPNLPSTLGSNARVVSANTTFTVGVDIQLGSTILLGGDGINPATGLHVLPGVTLIIQPNLDNLAGAGEDTASIAVNDGIIIEGTVTTAARVDAPANTSYLTLVAGGSFDLKSGSSIITAGTNNAPGSNGGNAGDVSLIAGGSLLSRATIDARGGGGDAGGNAGNVLLRSNLWSVYNSGNIDASGGAGNVTTGGLGRLINLEASVAGGSFTGGGLFNTGNLTCRGGDGVTGGGNAALGFAINFNQFSSDGPTVNTGALDCSGGNALTSGNGGGAGDMYLDSVGTSRIAGSMTARGGSGAGAGNGGNGGFIRISSIPVAGHPVSDGLFVGADIDMSGGNGVQGGNSGGILFQADAGVILGTAVPGAMPLFGVGYTLLDTTGGDGGLNGGAGGFINVINVPVGDSGGTPYVGSLLNEAALVARGGNGAGGTGGAGGPVQVSTTSSANPYPFTDRTIVNRGTGDTRGGSGATSGGNGGSFRVYDTFNAQNYAAINTSGGAGGTSPAGAAGMILMRCEGVTINEADLTADGGSSAFDAGGAGALVTLEGRTTQHTGDISAKGGNGVSSSGGNGGSIFISSWDGQILSVVSGTLGVQNGTGTPPGAVGTVTIDSAVIVLINGSVTY